MSKIAIENISEIKLNIIPLERRYNSKGDLAIDERVTNMYTHKNYDSLPKTKDERDARGLKGGWNGLMSSIPRFSVYSNGESTVIAADIAPTRYLIGQAMRDITKESKYTEEEIQKMSPNMANVSLIAPLKIKGRYYLLSQIKGKALGSGQIHTGIVAGNVDGKYLNTENPFVTTLQNECSEEIGLDLSYLNSTSFVFMVDERETGQINFASVTQNADLNTILQAYELQTKSKLSKDENLEVMALSKLPIAGLALTPLENGSKGLCSVRCYKPNIKGLIETVEDREVRPYTVATVEYLSKPENIQFLLKKAGF